MRITTAWAKVAEQNVTLRIVILCITTVATCCALACFVLASREPILIERTCGSKVIAEANPERTASEITEFLKSAVSSRFDSDVTPNPAFHPEIELEKRRREQEQLKKQGIAQKVVVDTIDLKKQLIVTDRLIKVDEVRSAVVFKLRYTLKEASRSRMNPYGLIITSFEEVTNQDN